MFAPAGSMLRARSHKPPRVVLDGLSRGWRWRRHEAALSPSAKLRHAPDSKRSLTTSRFKFAPQKHRAQLEKTMSVSGVSPTPTAPINVSSISVARSADGDYKARNALSAQVKDKDGDYKPIAATSSAAAQSSSAVQSSLPSLKKGG